MQSQKNNGLSYAEMKDTSDTALALAMKQGDARAFQLFYDSYYLKLLVQLKFLSINHQVAEDVCQEAFVKLWENRQLLDPSKSLTAYVRKIAHHLFIDVLRKQQLRQAFSDSAAKKEQAVDHVFEQLYQKELNAKLEEALQLLPQEKQKIYRLSREEQLTYKEIALLENTTTKAIERHMARTITFLKKYLEEYVDVAYMCLVGAFLLS